MKKYTILFLTLSLLLSAFAVWIVLFRLSPYDDTWWLSLGLFYGSTFFFLTSLFSLLGTLYRMIRYRAETHTHHLVNALRQGILLALFCLMCLFFGHLGVITWWNMTLLFVAFFLIELFFINRHSSL